MLDHYGSIVLNKEDIDKELIYSFKKKCHESYLKSIINNLRYEETLEKEYSVSGWNMFFRSNIHDIITIHINYKKQKREKIVTFVRCYHLNKYRDIDVCRMICDTYIN